MSVITLHGQTDDGTQLQRLEQKSLMIINKGHLSNALDAIAVEVTMTHDLKVELIPILEQEFGIIQTGMTVSKDPKINIVNYRQAPGAPNFISSLGLSHLILGDDTTRKYRSEWFMEFSPDLNENSAASVFAHFLSMCLDGKMDWPSRGSYVLYPAEEDRVWEGDSSRGLYFTLAAMRSKKFRKSMKELGVVPIWVLPVTCFETSILENSGWEALEEYFDQSEVDLHTTFRR